MPTRKKTTRVTPTKAKQGKRPAQRKAVPPEEVERKDLIPVPADVEDEETEDAAEDAESEDDAVAEVPAEVEPAEEAAEEVREAAVEPVLQADATRLYLKEIGFS